MTFAHWVFCPFFVSKKSPKPLANLSWLVSFHIFKVLFQVDIVIGSVGILDLMPFYAKKNTTMALKIQSLHTNITDGNKFTRDSDFCSSV